MLRSLLEWILGTDPVDEARRQYALDLAFRTCPRWIL